MKKLTCSIAGFALLAAGHVHAQIAISANDGKQIQEGQDAISDSVTVLNLSSSSTAALATIELPTSMIGPPSSVAVSPDGTFALVTASQRRLPDGSLTANDTLSVIDLAEPSAPKLIQSLSAGPSASGVAIDPQGKIAVVTNRSGDSISLFALHGNVLVPQGQVEFPAGSSPLDVAISLSGRFAYVVTQGGGELVELQVSGHDAVPSGRSARLGHNPYSVSINDAGNLAYVTNLGGHGSVLPDGRTRGSISIVDLETMNEVGHVDVGVTPEFVSISPTGRYLQLTLINGSNGNIEDHDYRDHGELVVLGIDGTKLSPIAAARTGRWCQGAAWEEGESRVFLQCADASEIEVYAFAGRALTRLPKETIEMPARPGAIATMGDR
jgi:DNA-binding beta-propeller fold protein YncE